MEKEKLIRFLRATELATQFIINNPNESWEIFSSTSNELQNELNKRAWFDTIPRFALRPFAYDEARYRMFQDFLLESKLIDNKMDITDFVEDITRNE